MNVDEMTRKQFDAVPFRGRFDTRVECDCLVVLPGRASEMHDSGFRCMDFVAVRKNKAVCRLSGCSDVIHIDGIGGYGKDWCKPGQGVPRVGPVKSWNIDCLAKSGLLRIFCGGHQLEAGAALSSFELYAVQASKPRPQPTTRKGTALRGRKAGA